MGQIRPSVNNGPETYKFFFFLHPTNPLIACPLVPDNCPLSEHDFTVPKVVTTTHRQITHSLSSQTARPDKINLLNRAAILSRSLSK
jgi:hypothetical protein